MASVVVTGGTGRLGRVLVPQLLASGHEVRVLSRGRGARLASGAGTYTGDVRTGEGVDAAVDGADVVVHAATSSSRHIRETEEAGTRHVADAARRVGAHVVYLSIVGVDRHRLPYYRAKYAAEQILTGSGADWTVLRATQFHRLLDQLLRGPLFVRTRRMSFQPVDEGEIAARLVELVSGPPQGRVPDVGGPEILGIRELADARREITGHRTRLVRAPAVGFLADFDSGCHLAPQQRLGTRTWSQWLADRLR